MIDKLPTEILQSELVQYFDKDDAFNLMLTCKTIHKATSNEFEKKYRLNTLINFDNPMFFNHSYKDSWMLRKSNYCNSKNYYEKPGSYLYRKKDIKL